MTVVVATRLCSDVQEISEQMERIQNELGSLTMLEMKKRDLKVKEEKAHDGRHFVLAGR